MCESAQFTALSVFINKSRFKTPVSVSLSGPLVLICALKSSSPGALGGEGGHVKDHHTPEHNPKEDLFVSFPTV